MPKRLSRSPARSPRCPCRLKAILRTCCLWFVAVLLCAAETAASPTVDFTKDVASIFQAHCVECHGPAKQKSSLRLDSRQALLAGGDSGPAIVPGDPDGSYLLELVAATDETMRMPPKGNPLSAEQISTLRRWIVEGAVWPGSESAPDPTRGHWAFQLVIRPAIPRVASSGAVNPIDRFLLAQLEQKGLSFSPPADARTFIRRATLDLTGLPPTPDEVESFVCECDRGGDLSAPPDAVVARLVDRLLASPRYGERWAQHWLDTVRYADTTGYEKNRVRPSAWPYRDYVIAAFNADIPYPQFIAEQLAGDVLGVDPATGFLVTAPFPEPIEVGQEPALIAQVRFNGLDEVVQNVSTAILGLTVGCARCHDHKFDPVSSRDYYRLVATFAGLQFSERAWDEGGVPVARKAQIQQQIEDVRRKLAIFSRWRETEPARVSDVFEPAPARWIRLTVTATAGSGNEKQAPALDELQVWALSESGRPGHNVAAAALGAVARSSGADGELDANDVFLNDGRHGPGSLWIATTKADEAATWVEIELPQAAVIDRVSWCGSPDDLDKAFVRLWYRLPTQYRVDVAERPGEWRTVVAEDRNAGMTEDQVRQRDALEQELAGLARTLRELSTVFAGDFGPPPRQHVLRRGDPQQPREATGPGGIDVLGGFELPLDASDRERRLALAKWLGSEQHRLTARVLVNRVWHHHFGAGLVDTPGDFGAQGTRPSHPELLDWLAAEFMSRGWHLKELHRLICNSTAYRQGSRPNPRALESDSDARLLWRFPPRRLEAEAIRDSMLSASGALDWSAGGPPVSVYKRERFGREWQPEASPAPETWRRSIYLLRVRGADDGVFKPFDVPDCGQVRAKRGESTTPMQALNLFNSPFVIEQCQRLAARARAEAGASFDTQIERLFALTLGRPPNENERGLCLATAAQHGLETVCRALLNSNEFLFLD